MCFVNVLCVHLYLFFVLSYQCQRYWQTAEAVSTFHFRVFPKLGACFMRASTACMTAVSSESRNVSLTRVGFHVGRRACARRRARALTPWRFNKDFISKVVVEAVGAQTGLIPPGLRGR